MPTLCALTGAVLSTTLLVAFGVAGPPGATLAVLAVPLAAILLGGRLGIRHAAAVAALSAVLVSAALGKSAALYYLALAGLPSVAVVCALRGAWRIESVVALAVAIAVVCTGVIFSISSGDLSALPAAVARAWRESFDASVALYRDFGASAQWLSDLEAQRDDLLRGLLEVLPAIVAVGTGVLWLANLRLSSLWVAWPQTQNLQRWQTPPWFIWVLIATGFAMFIPDDRVAVVARNGFAVALACYFLQGLAIVSYYLQRFGLPRGLRIASYLLIALQQIAAGIVLALGVFDFWGDFRQLGVPADASANSNSDQ